MANGLNRVTLRPMGGWPYTVQSLNVIATTMLSERVFREYVGALTPALLMRENLTGSALERFMYALLLQWELWVPMFDVKTWQYDETGEERAGNFGLIISGEHKPNAHLGDYALESNRQIRAQIASNAISIIGL